LQKFKTQNQKSHETGGQKKAKCPSKSDHLDWYLNVCVATAYIWLASHFRSYTVCRLCEVKCTSSTWSGCPDCQSSGHYVI